MEPGGWDTHANQSDRLGGSLWQLDAGLVALREALGPAWPAGGFAGTGPDWRRAGFSRGTTWRRPTTCAPSPKACWHNT